MARKKSFEGFACVGTHGGIYCTSWSPHPENRGRYEIYDTKEAAERMALTPAHVRRVRIIVAAADQVTEP
jgi:hypothetical protein